MDLARGPRSLDTPAVLDEPDVATWTAAMSAEVRKGLDGRTLTQLLLGEAVLVLEHRGEWVRVAALGQGSSATRAATPAGSAARTWPPRSPGPGERRRP